MKRNNLIKWQKQNGYKSKYVANKLGISETTYSLILNGKTTPTLDLAYKFNQEFNVDDVLQLLELGDQEDEI